ncbi:hypothetical protein [Streptomyces noursei]|uniref:Histidine kinase/HSP90-like ATPase domain-containing protein n=1 Tax=Streptomyces noursei TaxID=1971 RepID=A0A2N8PHU3_STRNR|nr:hypothetical protein AOB60_06815 [Streptomyces noursei]
MLLTNPDAPVAPGSTTRPSSPARVEVQPGAPDRLEVSVTDDGRASTPTASGKADGRGYGLIGLAERVEALAGTSPPGRRTTAAGASWPSFP